MIPRNRRLPLALVVTFSLGAAMNANAATRIERKPFGKTASGEAVELFTFAREGAPAIAVTNLGGHIEQRTQEPILLTAFHQWMRQRRGTGDATLYNYKLSIRELLESSGEEPRQFTAQSLRRFVLERSQRWGWAAAKKCTTALRLFLRFLIAEGKCPVGMDASIPQLAHWRL